MWRSEMTYSETMAKEIMLNTNIVTAFVPRISNSIRVKNTSMIPVASKNTPNIILPIFFISQMRHNVWLFAVAGIGGFKNGVPHVRENVKADLP
jgi:hypothetical protein